MTAPGDRVKWRGSRGEVRQLTSPDTAVVEFEDGTRGPVPMAELEPAKGTQR